MIAKKIHKKPENDCYRALALYICGLAKKEAHEKILDTWVQECEDPTDYMMGMYEIEATQAKNTRCQGLRTYHLVLSFRPEDEARLTPEIMRSIEEKFAESLGFQEHQRLCGVHKNTNNMHMHVAYNMINKKFRKNEPFRDFYKLVKVRKEIELEFGLVVDNNIEVTEPKRENTQARTVEAHSGQESFDTYIRNRKSIILDKLDLAKNWNDVHKILAEHGMGIKSRGTSGLVLHDLHGKQHAKASTLSKTQTSKGALEKRFGTFEPAERIKTKEQERYSRKPLQQNPNREQLYEKYQEAWTQKKAASKKIEILKKAEAREKSRIISKWKNQRGAIYKNSTLTHASQWTLAQEVYRKQKEELAELMKPRKSIQTQIRAKFPFSSWNDFLKLEALAGNETALEVLRSKKEISSTRYEQKQTYPDAEKSIENIQKKYGQQQQELLNDRKVQMKTKKQLLAVLKLKEKAELAQARNPENTSPKTNHQKANYDGLKVDISTSGVLIISLASGGSIRDTGKNIYFSNFDPNAQKVAQEYAQLKWGKGAKLEGNTISSEQKKRGLGR